MSYLLDTNVISELVRPKPDKNVLKWFDGKPNEMLYISVLTFGEIRKGVDRLTSGARKEQLRLWLVKELPAWFGPRCLDITRAVAEQWGTLLAEAEKTPSAIDSLLAATAMQHGLRMVTRNELDFRFSGLEVINPWTG